MFKNTFTNLVLTLGILAGAQANAQVIDHAFAFDSAKDGQNVDVLDYQYGNSKNVGTRAPRWAVEEGRAIGFENSQGPMLKGEFLFVKWRDKSTGNLFEVKVADLSERLPEDIENHTVYFTIHANQLFVYLISPAGVERTADSANEPRMYLSRKIKQIYPDVQ